MKEKSLKTKTGMIILKRIRRENFIKKELTEILRQNGFLVIPTTGIKIRGVSDLITINKDGKFVAIEIKDKSNLEPIQEEFLKEVASLNGYAFLIKRNKDNKYEIWQISCCQNLKLGEIENLKDFVNLLK